MRESVAHCPYHAAAAKQNVSPHSLEAGDLLQCTCNVPEIV